MSASRGTAPRATFNVVGLGEVLWDLLPAGPQLGGAPANFAYHAAALGARVKMVTRVGDDDLGREVFTRFARRDLSHDTVQIDRTRPTGSVAVTVAEDGVARYIFPDDVAWDRLQPTGAALAAARHADAVCFGTLAQRSATTRKAIQQLVAIAPAESLKIFDINLRLSFYSRNVIEESMHLANVLKLNADELAVIAPMFSLHGTVRQQMKTLARIFHFKTAVLTCGASGSLILHRGQWSEEPPKPTQVLDTVGAGDAFTAALTLGLLAGMRLNKVHALASDTARYVCSQRGATPALPRDFARVLGEFQCL